MDKIILTNPMINITEMFISDDLRSYLENENFDDLQVFFLGQMGTPKSWQIQIFNPIGESISAFIYEDQKNYANDIEYLKAATLKIEKNKEYLFSDLEKFAYLKNFDWNAYGVDLIGQGFLCLSDKKDKCFSFVYTSHNQKSGCYTCIYSDFKEPSKEKELTYYFYDPENPTPQGQNNLLVDSLIHIELRSDFENQDMRNFKIDYTEMTQTKLHKYNIELRFDHVWYKYNYNSITEFQADLKVLETYFNQNS